MTALFIVQGNGSDPYLITEQFARLVAGRHRKTGRHVLMLQVTNDPSLEDWETLVEQEIVPDSDQLAQLPEASS